MALLLSYAVLTLWIEERWAWGLFQFAVFAWATGWSVRQLWRPSSIGWSVWLVPLCAAPLWGLIQLAADHTVYRWGTWNAVLNWATWVTLCFLALQFLKTSPARQCS